MSAPDLDAIRARAAAASEGPWGTADMWGQGVAVHRGAHDTIGLYLGRPDAEFIAHAREDVPALLAEVERLRDDRDRWKQAYEMADPLLTDRDRLAATVARVRALADEMNAASDREAELADRFAGYHAGARSARMESEARLRAAIEGTDS